jgi:filamentous hemagglutinin family protein
MTKKIGIFNIMLRMLMCVLVLFPDFCLAGSVNIPGFYGSVAPKPAASVPNLPNKGGPKVNIPGFYGRGEVYSPPPTAHPTNDDVIDMIGISSVDDSSSPNKTAIYQNKEKAIINWKKFDIGADSEVRFDQKGNANWAALNRIWDRDPTYIFGKLTADGKIYLINQNGILFGPGSRINVNSLTASALNITNKDFLDNALKFYVETGETKNDDDTEDELGNITRYYKDITYTVYSTNDGPGTCRGESCFFSGIIRNFDPATDTPNAIVSNHGEVNAATGGSVFLIGPRVENFGGINAPIGQVGLAAGTQVELDVDSSKTGSRTALIVNVTNGFGESVNGAGGQLSADMGVAGMYGSVVNQEGIIRSVTAVKQNGQIELIARDRIITGSNSRTESPISTSPDTVDNSFVFSGGVVWMHGNFADPDEPSLTPPALIEHHGIINAPSGQVTMKARDRVFLETGSSINTGGAWSSESAEANALEVQLNSVELRDAYGQKGGLLQGNTISANILSGSAIGDISSIILSQQKTALEKSIKGGTINISVSDVNDGDIIVKQGALLDFSGGGIRYSGGMVDTTKLLSGNRIYDISNAPLNIRYDKILGQYAKTYKRFGITESYSGIYYGGASSLKTYVPGHIKGGSGGSLTLTAPVVVLDGKLNGEVTRGLFQTALTPYDPDLESAWSLSVARGLEVPTAGALTIGTEPVEDVLKRDHIVKEISVSPYTEPLASNFSSETRLTEEQKKQTVLSAAILNSANLGSLSLYANREIAIDSGAHVLLLPGGTFNAYTRRIEQAGEVRVPAGTINLTVSDNMTSFPLLLDESVNERYISHSDADEKIFLASGSRLDVAGERVDNSVAGKISGALLSFGRNKGGEIAIKDKTDLGQGVFIKTGAVVDVSGGYTIDQKGKIAGGNAGKLSIQGSNIMLDGDLRGYALADASGKIRGGSISLHSTDIIVSPESPEWPSSFSANDDVPDDPGGIQKGKFVLAGSRLDDTGFTQITLNSVKDVIIEPDSTFTTSLVRLNNPEPGLQTDSAAPVKASNIGSAIPGRPDLIRLDKSMAYTAGASSFAATAGKGFEGTYSTANNNMKPKADNLGEKITVNSGSVIRTAPGGTIRLSSPFVEVAGILEAPAGKISVTATQQSNGPDKPSLLVTDSAKILAVGYNRPDPSSTLKGFPMNYQAVSGGSVELKAANGDLILGGAIDVSGSEAVKNRIRSMDGKTITIQEAGDPGSLSLVFSSNLIWDGSVNARAKIGGTKGGTLTVSRTGSILNISAGDIERYLDAGFDDLTFQSRNALQFNGPINKILPRKLTLDAQDISGSGQDVALQSPWIVLENTSANIPLTGSVKAETGQLSLKGGWIDMNGSILMSGFQEVRLEADRDITLTDRLYSGESPIVSEGKFSTSGDLVLQADRIYPTTLSNYIFQTGGKVTILPADQHVTGPIYSAGGNLTIEAANGIENRGTLAAPMGTITLSAPGKRIYLAEDSVITTAGNNAMVNYGYLDGNGSWNISDKTSTNNNSPVDQDHLSAKGVNIEADETIVGSGAVIDVSGGGSLFAYQFQRGIEGSVDPLTKTGRYIVLGDRYFQLPGEAIYLTGGGGLSEGMYTLLDVSRNPQYARYAFLPGAYILETQAGSSIPGLDSLTNYGYPLVAGYASVADTAIRGTRPKAYSVRTAADVLKEGHYDTQELTAGDAGDMTIKGNTTAIDGVLRAGVVKGYQGGSVTLSGENVFVQSSSTTPLPDGFDFNSLIPDALNDKLTVTAGNLSGKGFRKISLGYLNPQNPDDPLNADTVTINSGALLDAPIVSLEAKQQITVEELSELRALTQKTKDSGEGVINLTTPGSLLVKTGSTLHASHDISLDVNNVQGIQGNLQVDHSAITLKSSSIFFDPLGRNGSTADGLYLTTDLWNMFTGFEDISLVASGYSYSDPDTASLTFVPGEIQFKDSFDLSAVGSITLDAARIAGVKADGADVVLTAPSIHLSNSGRLSNSGAASAMSDLMNAGHIIINGDSITAGGGVLYGDIDNNSIKVAGRGDVLFGGFKTIALNSKRDVIFKGGGSIATGNADLQIKAARVTTSAGKKADGTYQAPNFHVYTGGNYYKDFGIQDPTKYNPNPVGTITFTNSGDSPSTAHTPGGILEFWGKSIYNGTVNDDGTIKNGTVIKVDGGNITLVARGVDSTDGIFMYEGAQILARGTDDAPGGRVTLQTDNGSIALDAGSLIDVSAGYKKQSDGSMVSQGDAGLISLSAPKHGVVIDANAVLKGIAGKKTDSQGNTVSGKGGTFVLDTKEFAQELTDFSRLIDKLATKTTTNEQGEEIVISGGFTELIDLRARTGNIEIASGQMMKAHHIKLSADDSGTDENGNLLGQINVYGTIDASADTVYQDGGTAELYAKNDLNIGNSDTTDNIQGTILARESNGGNGGNAILDSDEGRVNINEDGIVDVTGSGGMIYMRARRNSDAGDDANIRISGTIAGQPNIFAEAYWVYENIATINAGAINNWQTTTGTFMNNAAAIKNKIIPNGSSLSRFHLLPGIELRSTGDITLGANWDLSSSSWRYGGEPGALTIRAAGNLNITSNLVDHPTSKTSLPTSNGGRDSWAFNLTAGADRSSADYLAVVQGKGDLNLLTNPGSPGDTPGTLVYTESAPLRFASGGDTKIGKGFKPVATGNTGYMINDNMYYNLASYDGAIQGDIGRDLVITGGAVQTATGDIDINIGRDLQLKSASVGSPSVATFGAIRTTGRSTAGGQELTRYWNYTGGGDISLSVGGTVGMLNNDGWTTAMWETNDQWDRGYVVTSSTKDTRWAASYENKTVNIDSGQIVYYSPTTGLATMGGGNLSVRTGGDFLTQAGTFGRNDNGDLSIYAGGDISGRFMNTKGRAEIHAMGNFGNIANGMRKTVIEDFDSRTAVTARGNIELAAVVNPIAVAYYWFKDQDSSRVQSWHIGYTEDASVSLKAGGDMTYAGDHPYYNIASIPGKNYTPVQLEQILPATLDVEAGGDIRLMNNLALLPAPAGNLRLIAGGSIDGQAQRAMIFVSDMDPKDVYTNTANSNIVGKLFDKETHAARPVHKKIGVEKEEAPIEIRAGQDIKNLMLHLPKRAEITAEKGDIRDIFYYGQNVNAGDVSLIQAKQGDILFSVQGSDAGVVQAGPGSLVFQAGKSINLGNTKGIQSVGNFYNPALGTQGSALLVLSGYNRDMTAAEADVFFNKLRKAGSDYSSLMAAGEKASADQVTQQARTDIISQFGSPSGGGDIKMTTSQISTVSGKSDIVIIANGQLDVGKSTFFGSEAEVQKTGIFTAGGGAINIFANGDINVNESRVMTFFGGDITVWSNYGNVNAGRGAKTEVSADPARTVAKPDENGDGVENDGKEIKFDPPAVGSGIRAVTFDPDSAMGSLDPPSAGDIYLFATHGVIDAGEAGISGGKVILGAIQVLNAANISFSAGSIGVPQADVGISGIGALSGTGAMAAQSSQLTSDASGIGAARAAQASQMIEDIMAKWLDVKFIDFVIDNEETNKEE